MPATYADHRAQLKAILCGWGMPEEILKSLPTYGGDLATRLAVARKIMQVLGYGPS